MVWQQAALQQPAGATTRTGNTGRKQPVRFAAVKVEKSPFVTASRNALAKRSILSGVIKRVAAASSRSSMYTFAGGVACHHRGGRPLLERRIVDGQQPLLDHLHEPINRSICARQ